MKIGLAVVGAGAGGCTCPAPPAPSVAETEGSSLIDETEYSPNGASIYLRPAQSQPQWPFL